MSNFFEKAQHKLKQLDTKFSGNYVLDEFEKRTNLPKSYVFVGGIVLYLFTIFINAGGVGEILCNSVGFILPTYYSLKALKTSTSADDTQLLTYWIVFAFFSVIEFWSRTILYWIPFYWFFKTLFLLFIAIPNFGGANIIYSKFIAPASDPYILPAVSSKAGGISSKFEQAAKDASFGSSSGASRFAQ